jgi:hypothetical protein
MAEAAQQIGRPLLELSDAMAPMLDSVRRYDSHQCGFIGKSHTGSAEAADAGPNSAARTRRTATKRLSMTTSH